MRVGLLLMTALWATLWGNQVSGADLIAYYPLNGNVRDASGRGNHGRTTATPTIDRFGRPNGAMDFDGDNDYMLVPNSPVLNPRHISVCVWVKFDRFVSGVVTRAMDTG